MKFGDKELSVADIRLLMEERPRPTCVVCGACLRTYTFWANDDCTCPHCGNVPTELRPFPEASE